MAFKAVWGFDPDEALRAQSLRRSQCDTEDSMYNAAEEHAARIPLDFHAQIYELRRIFRLWETTPQPGC